MHCGCVYVRECTDQIHNATFICLRLRLHQVAHTEESAESETGGLALVPTLRRFHHPQTPMSYTFDKKSEKSRESSRRHIALGIPTNTVVGPLGFRAELDVRPKGKSGRSYHDFGADPPDSTVISDDKDPRTSRIVFRDKPEKSGDPGLPVPAHAAVVGGTERGGGPMSECDCSLSSRPMFMRIFVPEEDTTDTREEGGEPAITPRGTYRYDCVVRFLLTSTSSGENPGGHNTQGYCRPH